jgi:hypothetical protein
MFSSASRVSGHHKSAAAAAARMFNASEFFFAHDMAPETTAPDTKSGARYAEICRDNIAK